MNKEYVEVFSGAFLNVMPQLGIADVTIQDVKECGKQINATGVVCIIGLVGDLHGTVIFSMREDCAKNIASNIMGGMIVEKFDEMTQNTISKLCNILGAKACMDLSVGGFNVDISTPTLMHGIFAVTARFESVMRIEMLVDELPFYIYVSLEQKKK